MNIRRTILLRVYLSYAAIALFGIAIVVQIVRLQFFEGKQWRTLADSLSTEYMNVDAVRGNIYASDGSLLATSLPEYEIRVDVNASSITDEIFYDKVDSLAYKLSNLFHDYPPREYARKFKKARHSGERYFLVKRNVSFSELKKMKTFPLFNLGRYKGGFIVVQKNKRVKPFKYLASRTIGYKVDGVQPVGLEGAYDELLGGQRGKRLMQRIAGGVWMPINDDDEIAPKDGSDVISTIDINIQDVAQNALLKQLQDNNADHGCVALMEVETGEIKAIANFTRTSEGVYEENYNYAVGESTEPGSTFKLASLISAFEDGYISLDDTVDTQDGKIKFYDHWLRDAHEGGSGIVTIQKAFEISSNVGIAKTIVKHYRDNPEKFIRNLHDMHLNEPIGLQIPGEGMPRIKTPDDKDWSGISLPQMSIGYEIKLTPLQILTFYNAIANNGKMIAPIFVKEIQSMGKKEKEFSTKVIDNKICSDATLAKVHKMLEGVVNHGTAVNLSTAIYSIAGKTGTAQIADRTRGYKQGKMTYQASFCGYFPANKPKYSMIVVVNAPSSVVYTGNYVAGPIFREIADKVYASSTNMHKDISEELSSMINDVPVAKAGSLSLTKKVYNKIGISSQTHSNAEWMTAMKNDNSVALVQREVIDGLVPNVVGMGMEDALYLLENSGLQAVAKGSGKVVHQSLGVGTRAIKGQTVYIELR